MEAQIIIIGTELTRGIISDKNGSFISSHLSKIGICVKEIEMIPDDGSIGKVLSSLLGKRDLIVITGGLGPTSDDRTRSEVAASLSLPLVENEEALEFLNKRLKGNVNSANRRQALFPEGFKAIVNNNGTAWGFYGYSGKTLVISLPGPPNENEVMFIEQVLPLLKEKAGIQEEGRGEYSVFLTAEANLELLCEKADRSLSWGTRFQDYKISLYVSGKSGEEREKAVSIIEGYLGRGRIAEGEKDALSIALEKLEEQKATISVAESCTGGLLSSLLTSLPGSSAYMLGSVTSYSNESKEKILGVKRETLEKFGAVSAETAMEMARGVRGLTHSTYSISTTGVAGPEEAEGKSVGTVYFGFSGKSDETVLVKFTSLTRESLIRRASVAALILLSLYAEGESVGEIVKGWGYI